MNAQGKSEIRLPVLSVSLQLLRVRRLAWYASLRFGIAIGPWHCLAGEAYLTNSSRLGANRRLVEIGDSARRGPRIARGIE